ncbi:MAG: AAA family ATPase [Candidatus Helarchaeota archaeon]
MKNFKSYENEMVEFITGRNVIHGLNGAGKTTILLAILYALLGRVQRLGKKVSLEELVQKGKNFFTIELEFEIDGINFFVERTNYLGRKEPVAKLYKDGDLVSEKQTAVTKEIIELLKIDSTTFENVIYIGQGEIPQIATQTPGDRKKTFDQFLNLDVYETIHTKFLNVKNQNKTQIQYLDQRINDLTKDVELLPEEEKKLLESQERLTKRKQEEIQFKQDFKRIQQQYEEEDKKHLEIENLEVSLQEKQNHIKKKDSLIIDKHRKLEDITETKLLLDQEELTKVLGHYKERKEMEEKKKKELEGIIKQQENLEAELENITKRIDDNKRSKLRNQKTIETNKETVVKALPELNRLDIKVWKPSIENKLGMTSKELKQLKDAREETIKKEKQLEKLNAELKSKANIMEKFEKDLQKELKKAEKIDKNWEETLKKGRTIKFEEELHQMKEKINQETEILQTLSKENAVFKDRLNSKNKEAKQIKSLKQGAKCPQCKQVVTDEHKQKLLQDIAKEISELEQEIERVIEKIKDRKTHLTEKKLIEEELQKQYTKFQKLEPIAENIATYKERMNTEKSEYATIKSKIDKIIIDKPSTEYKAEIAEQENRVNLYSGAIQNVENILMLQATLDELNAKMKDLKEKMEKITKEYKPDVLNKKRTELEQSKSILASLRDWIPEIDRLIEYIQEKNAYLAELAKIKTNLETKRKSFDIKLFEQIKQEKDQINQKIGEVKNDIKSLTKEIIPSLKSNIANMKRKKAELDERVKELTKEKKKASLIKIIREFCRQIMPVLRLQKTSQISAKATEIFLDLVGTSGEFDGITITENYDLYVKRYGVDEDITILSGGEQVLSCLAIRLAISEILANQGLILLDEPTSHLDEMHVKDLVEVFELYTPVRQLITVTHDDEFEKIADSLIQVYKEEGTSQIL